LATTAGPSLCFFRSSCLHSAEKGESVSLFTDIFLFFLPRAMGVIISAFISLSSAMPRARILHLAAGIVGWVGEFRQEQIGDLAHGFAPIKP
jgi:hypothetical protein